MPEILLTTLNSRFHHASFGLRYLMANMGDQQANCEMREFTIGQNPRQIAKSILKTRPRILGFGVYIWNTREILDVLRIIRKIEPDIVIVLGGPEISFETETQELYKWCNHVVIGEADHLFPALCADLLAGVSREKLVRGSLPEISKIHFPYDLYSDSDIQNRVLYVEASRGCPYKCEYCLSSLDVSVRNFDVDTFLSEMQKLIDRGARQFKFVDRTFNLSPTISQKILKFFLERIELGLFLHFEMVPDRLPPELKDLIIQFPTGSLQFEIGIQTWNPDVAARISRRQDYQKIAENLIFLNNQTGVHIHADLIAGLPGEGIFSFANGFDSLAALGPHEIQVGILKRLKGTPIVRHDREWQMVYNDSPPFQILKTKDLSFFDLLRIQRFADYWDLYGNSGHFKESKVFLKELAARRTDRSLFFAFDDFCEFLEERFQNTHGIALDRQFDALHDYLVHEKEVNPDSVRHALSNDYRREGRTNLPSCLRIANSAPLKKKRIPVHNARQNRAWN